MSASSNRWFWTLLVVTGLVVAGAAWISTRKGADSEADSELWLPGLRGDLDRISAIQLTGAGNQRLVTIERGDSGFVVVERGGYRADTAILRKLLLQLADARLVEAKTTRADRHSTLGVESVASPKATGVRVEIKGAAKPLSFTVGRTADQLGGGTFVRLGEHAEAWLVSGNLVVEREPGRWLEKRIVDIPAARIERIDVQSKGDGFALVRETTKTPAAGNPATDDAETGSRNDAVSPDDSDADLFVIEGVSAAELASPYAAVATASALSELDLLDVGSRKKSPQPAKGGTELRFVVRNGVSVIATVWLDAGKTLVQLNAAATPGPGAEEGVAAATPSAVVPATGRTGDQPKIPADPPSSSASDLAVDAAVTAFNRQWQHWTYVVPPHRSAGLMPTRAALLKQADGP
ncbi:MAG: DUF4340 domain-containing protein [Lysobacterales bacterium]